MEEQNMRNKPYITIPESKDYTGAFLMEEVEVPDPRRKWIIDHLIKGTPELDDFNGNPNNLGDVFRHLKKKGLDISELEPILQAKRNFLNGVIGMVYIPCSQNGNIQ